MTRLIWILSMLALAGCASDIPRAIREAPATEILPAQALAEADALKGQTVRWGGSIAHVENRKDETWVEIIQRPLYSGGEPDRHDAAGGRFLAKVPGFLDPEVYAPRRLMTVAGILDGTVTHPIGEYPYRFPVVQVSAWYLWAPPPVVHYYTPYYWYDPWYPWYPWRPVYPYPPPRR